MKQEYYVNTGYEYTNYINVNAYGGPCIKGSIERKFDNYDDAVTAAKKEVARTREDVVIYKIAGVAKFPLDDVKVEEVV